MLVIISLILQQSILDSLIDLFFNRKKNLSLALLQLNCLNVTKALTNHMLVFIDCRRT